MAFSVQSEAPPLCEDADGAVRVGNSRVLLELVIHAFQDGATPEEIVQTYDSLSLPDAYAVVAYYLRHPGEIDEYLAQHEHRARAIQSKIESHQRDLSDIRARILTRRRGQG